MKRITMVLYYIAAVLNYLVALHPIFDKTTHHDTWDTVLYVCLGTVFLCVGLSYSFSQKKDDNSDSDDE